MCHKWIHFRETEGLGREAALGLEPVGSRTRSPPVAHTPGLAPKPDLAETLRRRGEPRSPWLAQTRGRVRCAPAPRPGARLSCSREAEDRHGSCCCPPGQGPGYRAAAGPTHTHQVPGIILGCSPDWQALAFSFPTTCSATWDLVLLGHGSAYAPSLPMQNFLELLIRTTVVRQQMQTSSASP